MAYDPGADLFDADEDEELGYDTHVPFVRHVFDGTADTHVDMPRESIPNPAEEAPARVRLRPMSSAMMVRYPDVRSLLVAKTDGRQVMFVRPA